MPSVRELLLQLRGDDVSAGSTLRGMAAQLEAFSAINAEAKLGLDDTEAKAKLDRISAEAFTVEGRAYLDDKEAEARLDALGSRDVTVEARVDLDDAEATARVDRFGAKEVTIPANVDVDTGGALAHIIAFAATARGILGSALGGGGARDGGRRPPLDPLGLAPGGGAPNIFSSRAATQLLFAALPALPTVGASLVQGAVGAGALGVAGVGVATPVLGLLAGLAKRFTEASQAATTYRTAQKGVRTTEAAVADAQAASAQAEANLSRVRQDAAYQIRTQLQTALDQLNTAEENVTQTNFQAQQAEEQLTEARRTARRAIIDEQNAARDATLNHRQAVLQLREAERQYAEMLAAGTTDPLQLAQGRLAISQAEQQVRESRIQSNRAHTDAHRLERQGVSGAPAVEQARFAVQQATQAQADAARQLAEAEQSVNHAEQQTVANSPSVISAEQGVTNAHRNLEQAQLRLAHAQHAAAQAQVQFTRTIPEREVAHFAHLIGVILTPAFDAIAGGMARAGRIMAGVVRDLRPQLTTLGGEIGQAFAQIAHAFATPAFEQGFARLIDGATQVVRILTPAAIALSKVLLNIAVAALPDLLSILRGLRDATEGWARSTSNVGRTRDTIHGYIEQFRDWLRLIGAVLRLLGAVFLTNNRSAREGGSAVRSMTRTLDGWANWLQSHRHQVSAFWHNLLNLLSDVVQLLGAGLGAGIPVLITLAKAAEPLADAVKAIVDALNSIKVGPISLLTGLLGLMAAGKVIGAARALGALFGGSLLGRLLLGGGAAGGAAAGAEGVAGGAAAGAAGGGLLRAGATRLGLAGIESGAADIAGGSVLGGAAITAGIPIAITAATYKAFTTSGGILDTIAGRGSSAQLVMQKVGGLWAQGIAAGIKQDRSVASEVDDLGVGELRRQHGKIMDQYRQFGSEDARTYAAGLAETGRKVAREAAQQIADAIHAQKIGEAFAKSVAEHPQQLEHALQGIRRKFADLNTAQQDDLMHAVHKRLELYKSEGLIQQGVVSRAMQGLEAIQDSSQQHQLNLWKRFRTNILGVFGSTFGSLYSIVKSVLGENGVTRMVNEILTGVGAGSHKLKFTAPDLVNIVSDVTSAVLGGGAAGGFLPGYSRSDDRLLAVRGGEAILRPEDHVPFVDRAIRIATRGAMGLREMFERTGARISGRPGGYARGGQVRYALPWPGGTSAFGELDRGIDVGGTGPVFAMDSGEVVRPSFNLFSNYGTSTSGLVYRMDHPPKGYAPSSPYVYIYELFNPEGPGASGGRVRAGQLLGHIMGGTGIEMGWAAGSSGTPLADALGEDIAARHTLPRGLATSISLQNFIAAIQSGKHIAAGAAAAAAISQLIPKIAIKGPKGALLDAAQGSVDKVRREVNARLRKLEAAAAPSGAAATGAIPANIAKGSVAAQAAAAVRRARATPVPALALFEALWAESSMGAVPNPLQLTSSFPAGVGPSSSAFAQAYSFLVNGYGVRPGAIALHRSNPTELASGIAQDVQRSGAGSASHGTANYGAKKGAAEATMRQVGLATRGLGAYMLGGFVPGFAGGGESESGETPYHIPKHFFDTKPGAVNVPLGAIWRKFHMNIWQIYNNSQTRAGQRRIAAFWRWLDQNYPTPGAHGVPPSGGPMGADLTATSSTVLGRALTELSTIAQTITSALGRGVAGAGIPLLADGARQFGGGLAVVGERGLELANFATGTDVYSAQESRRILDAAARGGPHGGDGPLMLTLNGDFYPNGKGDPVEAFLHDRRVEVKMRNVAGEEIHDFSRHLDQRDRMNR